MTENKPDQEAAVPSEGQQPQPQQPPQAEPIKTRGAKLLETAAKLRAGESARRQTEELSHILWHMNKKPPGLGPICNFQAQTSIELDQLLAGLTANPDAVTCPQCLAVLAEQQPEKSTPVVRDLPGQPSETKPEGDNHDGEVLPGLAEIFGQPASQMIEVLNKIVALEHEERTKALTMRERHEQKGLEFLETQNTILDSIREALDGLSKTMERLVGISDNLAEA